MNIREPPVRQAFSLTVTGSFFTDLAATDFQGGDVGGHQLGQAGRWQALVAVVLYQDLAAAGIHEHKGFGGQLRRRRHHLDRERGWREKQRD
nr:hypothetical protein GCM10020185_44180 [Pseudomonas brassicacearum subsp. brassicacearum]